MREDRVEVAQQSLVVLKDSRAGLAMCLTQCAPTFIIITSSPLYWSEIRLPSLLMDSLNSLPCGLHIPDPAVHLEDLHHQALREAADPDDLLIPEVRRSRILCLASILEHHQELMRLQVVALEVIWVEARWEGGVLEGQELCLLH